MSAGLEPLQQQVLDYLAEVGPVTHRGLVIYLRSTPPRISEAVRALTDAGEVLIRDGKIRLRRIATDAPEFESVSASVPASPSEVPPVVAPVVEAPRPAPPPPPKKGKSTHESIQARVLRVIGEQPWSSSRQIAHLVGRSHTHGSVSGALSTLWNLKKVARIGQPTREANGGFRYALPGTPEPVAAETVAELLTAPPPIVDVPTLPDMLEIDLLRAEVERLRGERLACLKAMGFTAAVDGDGDVVGATKATVENMVGANKRYTALLQRYRDLREKLHDAFKLPNGIEDDALLRQARWLEGRASAHLQPEPLVTLRLVVEDVGGDHPGATLLASAPEYQPTGATLQNLTREQAQALGPHLYADVLLQIVPAPASASSPGLTSGAGAGASE